ncbi:MULTISPECIES: GNAT family N-acetyltransferase [Streptomyces]|uniref:GNAT family N-acetyltransferase n=1 Tax=Streptomyces TaxID=1883 RepID=UPI001E40777F|nr:MULTISPECIES: GNAT family N-acetyltransferase [Streptomyces]UFQ18945.1 GNAT family N-acetyltransferase [Streptomyces huasconensis]WCL88564.1 GNAT family N-acetyltransferase [Streptomyces sp. JCM 35825]
MPIRPATAAELPALQDIERAAGEAFRALGMDAVADDEPPTVAELERFRRAGGAWVAAGGTGAPLAYLLSEPLDEPTVTATASRCEHIEQITVHPRAARRGIGRALIDHLAGRTLAEGGTALTLTTFADVPWNAPYYARIGFRPLTEAELTPALRKIRAHEAELGLDRWPRLCMRRALTPRTAP